MSQNDAFFGSAPGESEKQNDSIVNNQNSVTTNAADSVANTTVTKDKKNSLRRAFSMPRNPFRLSRKFKLNKDSVDRRTDAAAVNASNASAMNDVTVPTSTTTITTTTTPPINSSKATTTIKIIEESGPRSNQLQDNGNKSRLFRRSSWKKFISRIATQMTSINIGAKQTANSTDRVPPLGGYVWPPDQIPGVTGLKNHGNTCFMNAVLQCLSHTDILAEYFVLDQYKADLKRRNKLTSRKFGTKGELTEQLALVLKALWTCKFDPDYSTSFKAVVDRYGSQFRSSTQHDAQEFLFWLLDKVHEDLNTASKRKYKSIKNNYGRPDEVIAAETLANHIRCNSSFVQAVFQAQFRSSLACPQCHKQSNTFDPFHCISVQLPQLTQQPVFVTVLYATQHPRQVKLGIGVPPGSPIIALREQLQADTGIALDRIMLTEITETGFGRVFCDSYPMVSLSEDDPIYCVETLPITAESTNLTLIIVNVQRASGSATMKRFGTPFCLQVDRDVSYSELQKKLLKELQHVLKSEVFAYATQPSDMFKIRLQDPSADPDTYIEPNVEHPLFTEMIDLALSVLPTDVGPSHVKLVLEWTEPDKFFVDMSDAFVEHESVSQFKDKCQGKSSLTLEQCLEHYTKAETLSTEDAWRCPHCQKYLPVVKTLGLWSLPDILVIHFKRFRQQQTKGPQAAKLTTTVKFPLNGFDMSPHLAKSANGSNEDNWSPWRKMKKRENCMQPRDNRYDLYAVCYHQGDTLETGHYTAACKNPYDHHWYKFDDQKVSQVPVEDIPGEIVNNEAYILFYQRRKADTMECSGSSSVSGDHWVSKIAVAPPSASNNTSAQSSAAALNLEEKKEQMDAIEVDEQKPVTKSSEIIPVVVPMPVPSSQMSPTANANSKSIEVDVEINNEGTTNGNCDLGEVVKIVKTNEEQVIDVEGIESELDSLTDVADQLLSIDENMENDVTTSKVDLFEEKPTTMKNMDEIELVELRRASKKVPSLIDDHLSTSVPTQRSLWPTESGVVAPLNRGSLNFSELLSSNLRRDQHEYNIRHSMSTTMSVMRQQQHQKENDTIAMIRGATSCSKDTVLFMDQQSHSFMDDDSSYMGNRSLWISPVTPHKFITISPKN